MTPKPHEQVIERLEERLTQTSSNAAHARIELDTEGQARVRSFARLFMS